MPPTIPEPTPIGFRPIDQSLLADRPTAVTALTRIFLDEIERWLIAAVGCVPDAAARPSLRPRLGAVSFLHRFGSALNRRQQGMPVPRTRSGPDPMPT